MTKTTLIKRTETTYTENVRMVGPMEVTRIVTFETFEVDGRTQVIETIQEHGVIKHSACYPINSEWARNRIETLK